MAVRCQTCSSSSCICSRVKASRAPKGSSISKHARVGRQRAGQADALFLAAGELPDPAIVRSRGGPPARAFPGPGFRACRVPTPASSRPKRDVGQHVLPGQQGVVLEHHAAFGARALDRHAVEGDAPGAGLDEAGNQVQQRSLAAAGRAEGDQQLLGPRLSRCPPAPGSGLPGYCALMRSSCSKAIAVTSGQLVMVFGADVRCVVRQYGFDLALLLEERSGVGDGLGGWCT